MKIITYQEKNQTEVIQLIKETIQRINRRDYCLEQVQTWAMIDETAWSQAMLKKIGKIAIIDHQIVGFADVTDQGYIDYLFVHKDFQRKGIAKALLHSLEAIHPAKKLTVAASITARGFFEKQGFIRIQENVVFKNGVGFINFTMVKPERYTN